MKKGFSQITDQELLTLSGSGNTLAFNEIFNRYWKRLFTYAYKVYEDEKLCEDMIQEIFLSLWERRGEVVITNLEAYLFKSVKYRLASNLRNLKFTERHFGVLEELPVLQETDQTIAIGELEEEVCSVIDNLPARCKEVFYLSRFESLNNKEIAERLNISVRTVETHISNALKYLRGHLDVVSLYVLLFGLGMLFC